MTATAGKISRPNKKKKIEMKVEQEHEKDIAQVAMHGTSELHDVLPGTEGDSDNQNVPPSISSTFIYGK